MNYKNISVFLKKYFLILIPAFILIIIFLYPIFRSFYESLDGAYYLKRLVTNEVVLMYEKRKETRDKEYQSAISVEGIQKCTSRCPIDDSNKIGLLSANYYCELKCENPDIQEPDFYIKSNFSKEQKYIIENGKYDGFNIYEIKEMYFIALFSNIFIALLGFYFNELIGIFTFQNIIIIILILILYYNLFFGFRMKGYWNNKNLK